MRSEICFGEDGELYVLYEHFWNATHQEPSTSLWLIPGTHHDDPSYRD